MSGHGRDKEKRKEEIEFGLASAVLCVFLADAQAKAERHSISNPKIGRTERKCWYASLSVPPIYGNISRIACGVPCQRDGEVVSLRGLAGEGYDLWVREEELMRSGLWPAFGQRSAASHLFLFLSLL